MVDKMKLIKQFSVTLSVMILKTEPTYINWACGVVGSAFALQAKGHWFDSDLVH